MTGSKTTKASIGVPTSRIDGRLKVTGEARYGSDMNVPNPAYAFLATSSIARGRIAAIDDREARAIPGVLDVLTHETLGAQIKPVRFSANGGYASSTIRPLDSEKIWYAGQIIAVVLADSFEAARDGAHRLSIAYKAET